VVLTNHIHLLAEARTARSLSRGVRGLCVRIARALNEHWGRSGRVFEHRFHSREIGTPLEAKNAIAYVLLDARRHGLHVSDIDPYSSAAWFDEWRKDASGLADPPRMAAATRHLAPEGRVDAPRAAGPVVQATRQTLLTQNLIARRCCSASTGVHGRFRSLDASSEERARRRAAEIGAPDAKPGSWSRSACATGSTRRAPTRRS
jgi:hypothetical protein